MNASNNNNKDNITEQLSGLLDGELSPEVAEALAEKVSASAELEAELQALKRTRELLGNLPRKNAPSGFCDDILEQIERKRLLKLQHSPQAKRSSKWLKIAASAAIVAITGGIFMYISSVLGGDDWVSKQAKLNSNSSVTLSTEKQYDINKVEKNISELKIARNESPGEDDGDYKLSLKSPVAPPIMGMGLDRGMSKSNIGAARVQSTDEIQQLASRPVRSNMELSIKLVPPAPAEPISLSEAKAPEAKEQIAEIKLDIPLQSRLDKINEEFSRWLANNYAEYSNDLPAADLSCPKTINQR